MMNDHLVRDGLGNARSANGNGYEYVTVYIEMGMYLRTMVSRGVLQRESSDTLNLGSRYSAVSRVYSSQI